MGKTIYAALCLNQILKPPVWFVDLNESVSALVRKTVCRLSAIVPAMENFTYEHCDKINVVDYRLRTLIRKEFIKKWWKRNLQNIVCFF